MELISSEDDNDPDKVSPAPVRTGAKPRISKGKEKESSSLDSVDLGAGRTSSLGTPVSPLRKKDTPTPLRHQGVSSNHGNSIRMEIFDDEIDLARRSHDLDGDDLDDYHHHHDNDRGFLIGKKGRGGGGFRGETGAAGGQGDDDEDDEEGIQVLDEDEDDDHGGDSLCGKSQGLQGLQGQGWLSWCCLRVTQRRAVYFTFLLMGAGFLFPFNS